MLTRSRSAGFTLVELIASATVITLLMLMLVQMSRATGETWKRGITRSEQFRESRRAFEIVTRRLSNATLNTYWDYVIDVQGNPTGYQRQSELRFRVLSMENQARDSGYHPTFGVFFQSQSNSTDVEDSFWTTAYASKSERGPLNRLDGLVNTWGYFLEVADSTKNMPPFLGRDALPQYRSRLLEFREDTKALSVYKLAAAKDVTSDAWFLQPISKLDNRPTHVVAENIIAMVILPRLSANDEASRKSTAGVGAQYQMLSPAFTYDSKKQNNYGETSLPSSVYPGQINPFNQLPPVVQVAMFALDEISANKLAQQSLNKRQMDLPQLLEGLFQRGNELEMHNGIKGDLATLETRLQERKLGYRLFVSNVPIRGARWSSATSN